MGERIGWAIKDFVPIYIEEKRDVQGLCDEGRGWLVRTGYTRSRKTARKVEKDLWRWELKRRNSNDLLRWIAAGRFSELGGEVWVVQGEVWEKAVQLDFLWVADIGGGAFGLLCERWFFFGKLWEVELLA